MNNPPEISVGDWIERKVHAAYCKWARVVDVYPDEEKVNRIQVVYLDGNQPVRDNMILKGGRWDFEYEGPSGLKLNSDRTRTSLRQGPPMDWNPKENKFEYRNLTDKIWRLSDSEDQHEVLDMRS